MLDGMSSFRGFIDVLCGDLVNERCDSALTTAIRLSNDIRSLHEVCFRPYCLTHQHVGSFESCPWAPLQLAVVETFADDPLPLVTPLYSWHTFFDTPQELLTVAVSP